MLDMFDFEGVGHLEPTLGPSVKLLDTGDFDAGDGIRLLITNEHLHIQLRRYEREGYIAVPIEAILDALVELSKKSGS